MSSPGTREILITEFDVEDAIGRRAGNRCKDPKASIYRVLVVPVWIDGVVMAEPWQTLVRKAGIRGGELGISVGRQSHRIERLVIEGVGKGQRHRGGAVVAMIAYVRVPWDDTGLDLIYVVVVLRRATFDCVTAGEGRVRVAELIGDRPGGDARRHAPAEIEMQREAGGHVSVDHLDSRHTAANI